MFKKHLKKLALTLTLSLAIAGAFGARAIPVHAQTGNPPTVQTQDCSVDQAGNTADLQAAGADTDKVDLQCGDSSAADNGGDKSVNGTDPASSSEQIGEQSSPDNGSKAETLTGGADTDTLQQGEGQQVEDGQPDLPNAVPETPGK